MSKIFRVLFATKILTELVSKIHLKPISCQIKIIVWIYPSVKETCFDSSCMEYVSELPSLEQASEHYWLGLSVS